MEPTRLDPREASARIFSGLAETYERVLDAVTFLQDRKWKAWASRRIPSGEDKLILDVGCGTLVLEQRLRRTLAKFVGLDVSQEMIVIGRAKRLPNVCLLANADAESLPFPDDSFDAVVSCYVPKYVDVVRFANELGRVTKRGGSAVLYDFARPRGFPGIFVETYIQGGLRLLGLVLRLARREEAFTFDNLPRIIEQTSWDRNIAACMVASGFEMVEWERFTGGAVFACFGRKG